MTYRVVDGDGDDAMSTFTITVSPPKRAAIDWTQGTDLVGTFYAIVWNGTRFVAVGTRIAYSDDGIHWTLATTPDINTLQSVVWNGTGFVAVGTICRPGTCANIVHSSDGINWEAATMPPDSYHHLDDIAWSGSRFVAVGYSEYSRSRGTDRSICLVQQ